MENIIIEAGGQLEGRSEIIGSLLKLFMLYLSRQNEKSNDGDLPSRRTLLIDRFYRLLERNFMTLRSTSQYASELAISASYLNEVVKSTSGFSASYHIRQRITQEAKKMAILHEASMKEIAYNLGFYDPAHFSKYFKNCTGKSFSDFRRGVGIIHDQNSVIA